MTPGPSTPNTGPYNRLAIAKSAIPAKTMFDTDQSDGTIWPQETNMYDDTNHPDTGKVGEVSQDGGGSHVLKPNKTKSMLCFKAFSLFFKVNKDTLILIK